MKAATSHGGDLTRLDFLLRGGAMLVVSLPLARAALSASSALAANGLPRCELGAFVPPATRGVSRVGDSGLYRGFEALAGRKVRIGSSFVAWTEDWPNELHVRDREEGRIPLIAWDGRRDLAAVAGGRWDGLLRRRAAAVREFGSPVRVRWGAEFNGSWNPAFGRSEAFVAAWRHVVDVFRAEGAANADWVWCPYAFSERSGVNDWRPYYPGDRYVDWVGMDGYNWGATRSWSSWQSFSAIFGPLYRDYAGRKPIAICEVASAEAGGDKAAWIRDMGFQLRERFPAVRSLAWFDIDKETDWRINSSQSSLAAFRGVVADPRFA